MSDQPAWMARARVAASSASSLVSAAPPASFVAPVNPQAPLTPDELLRAQLLELEQQILGELDKRRTLGDALARLEQDNLQLRSQLNTWKNTYEAPALARAETSSIDAFETDTVAAVPTDVTALPSAPLDPSLSAALEVCVALSASNASARQSLVKHLQQRRQLACELSHLQRVERLRWNGLIEQAKQAPFDPSILDSEPFENAPDPAKLTVNWKNQLKSLADAHAASKVPAGSTPHSVTEPTPTFTALHPTLLAACLRASQLPPTKQSSALMVNSSSTLPPSFVLPRAHLGTGATLSVAGAVDVTVPTSQMSIGQLLLAAGYAGEGGEPLPSDSEALTEHAANFVITALEANRIAYKEAKEQEASAAGPVLSPAEQEIRHCYGFSFPPAAEVPADRTDWYYPFDEPDSENNIQFETSAEVAAAAKAALEAGATNNSANNSNVVASTEQPIRFATLHKLVERVCHEKHQDMTLRYVFLLTYRSFCTPQELFSALRSRFYVPLPPNMSGPELDMFKKSVLAPIQIKVLAVLKNWVEEHWLADFAFQAPADAIAAEKAALEAGTPETIPAAVKKTLQRAQQAARLLADTKALLETLMNDKDAAVGPWAAKSAKALLAQLRKREQPNSSTCASQLLSMGAEPTRERVVDATLEIKEAMRSEFPKALVKNVQMFPNEFDFATSEELEIARQLTLLDFTYFRHIMPRECVDTAWSKKDRESAAPHIVAFINQFNSVASWLQAEIVAVESLTKRASMLKRFIKIAEHLMALNNFNSLFAMYCGLGGNPIHRLKKTWAELPAKTVAKWEEIKALFKIDKNSANFREVLRKAVCPAIPYLGLFLGDLTFMEDGNPSMGGPRGDLVNVSKRRLIADRIKWIQQYQQVAYVFQPIPAIQIYLHDRLKVTNEDALYKESLRVEPRESS